MKRYLFLTPAFAAILASVGLTLLVLGGCLTAGCALNVHRQDQMTDIKWRVGLAEATLLHGTASLPNDFDMDIGSDCGDWLVARTLEASSGGATLIGDVFDFAFGWVR